MPVSLGRSVCLSGLGPGKIQCVRFMMIDSIVVLSTQSGSVYFSRIVIVEERRGREQELVSQKGL